MCVCASLCVRVCVSLELWIKPVEIIIIIIIVIIIIIIVIGIIDTSTRSRSVSSFPNLQLHEAYS